MGKLIWKGFDKQGEKISSQPFAITGANLRKSSDIDAERLTGDDIRSAFKQATRDVPGPFNLEGRNHEMRCHFNRRLAAYMRGVELPHVVLSGYGANKYYPLRLVKRAAEILNRSMKREVLRFHNSCAYIDD